MFTLVQARQPPLPQRARPPGTQPTMQSAFGCGGGVVQREHWDLTRCFEERVVLLIPLALLFLASVVRIWALSRENARERTVRSLRLLLVKEVRAASPMHTRDL
jgi:hypothetical protein